ncbi:recombinase family protein [Schinkia sp. CFF1]
MIVNVKIDNKQIAVYIRVSSKAQSEEMQLKAAIKWLNENGLTIDDIEMYNEHALSANVVLMENRPKLMELREAIRAGKIKKLLVFTRCRLARNFYEYLTLVGELHKYGVEVIFTCSGTPNFSQDILVEGIYGIQIQSEGKNIRDRLHDVHSTFPPSKFGYIKKVVKIND